MRFFKKMIEGAMAERAAAQHPARGQYTLLVANAPPIEICPQFRNTAEGKILPEDQADAFGLLLVDDQLAVLDVVAERDDVRDVTTSRTRTVDLRGPIRQVVGGGRRLRPLRRRSSICESPPWLLTKEACGGLRLAT
jgi:hypothetical protein